MATVAHYSLYFKEVYLQHKQSTKSIEVRVIVQPSKSI